MKAATSDKELVNSLNEHISEFIQYLSDSHQLIPGHLIQLAESIGQGMSIQITIVTVVNRGCSILTTTFPWKTQAVVK